MKATLPQPNLDAHWKDVIIHLHTDFVRFFLPSLATEIDFSKDVRLLDKELQQLLPGWHKKGLRTCDLLLEYHLLSGQKQLVLVHVEVQHTAKPDFGRRMHVAFSRIIERYPKCAFTSIAIFTGADIPADYGTWRYDFHGTRLFFEFNCYIVRDQEEKALLNSTNPFGIVVLAAWSIIRQKRKFGHDYEWLAAQKLTLARMCFKRGHTREQIEKMLTFVSFAIALPEEVNLKYEQKVIAMLNVPDYTVTREENPQMFDMLVRIGLGGKRLEDIIAEAKQQGAEQAAESLRKNILKMHSNGISTDLIANILEVEKTFVEQVINEK